MIEAIRIQQVAEVVRRAGLSEQTLSALREGFSDIHFTYCMDDDLGVAEPFRQGEGLNIYLIDGREHCLKLTSDLDLATGLVLAQVGDED